MTFLLPLIGLIAGIVIGDYVDGPLWSALPILGALLVYLVILRKSRIPMMAFRLNRRHSIWIVMLFMGVGMLTSWAHKPTKLDNSRLDNYVAVYGEVTDVRTAVTGDLLTMSVSQFYDRVGKPYDVYNTKILVKTDGYSTTKGDQLLLPCKLSVMKDNENYRATGYASRMLRNGILYTTYATADEIVFKGHSNSPVNKSSEWRDRIEIAIEKSSLQRETAEFLISILLGDRSFLDQDVKATFNNAGVAHVLALSGMHVAIIMGIILFLLFPIKAMGLHRLRYWLALILVWGFAYFTGFAASTVRACIMTTFLILALSIQRKNASSNALLASAFVILLFEPSALYDVGMQLSFLCVACILAFAAPFNTVNQHLHPKLHSLNASILVSLVATLGTWVVVSYYFKRIPLLFLPVNLIMLPLLPFYLSVGLGYTILCLCGLDLTIFAKVLDFCYDMFMEIANRLSAFGNATIEYQATLPVVVLWLLGVLMIGYAIHRRHKVAAGVIGAAMFVGSIAMIPIMSSAQPDGMIFQKRYSDISMALYDSDNENILTFPRNTVSKINFKGHEIISVDCINQLYSLAAFVAKGKTYNKKRYLILGSGYKNRKLSDIPELGSFEKIIVHPSIRRKREQELLEEAVNSGIDQIHSLRNDGALEITFD